MNKLDTVCMYVRTYIILDFSEKECPKTLSKYGIGEDW